MIKKGDAVIYKGRQDVDYVGKKATVEAVEGDLASLVFSDGHVWGYARLTHLKPVAKAAKKSVKKVSKVVKKSSTKKSTK